MCKVCLYHDSFTVREKTMLLSEAIAFFGSDVELAEALDVTPQAISGWRCRSGNPEFVPSARQYQLQILSRGKLRADIPEKA
jgi:hypothetical protein